MWWMRIKIFFQLLCIGSLFLLLTNSCEIDPDEIGLDILPGKDALNVSFDSIENIKGYTFFGDSIWGNYKSKYLLGSLKDTLFGLTTAEIVSGIQTTATNGSFGSNPVVDSVILSLKIDNIKGVAPSGLGVRVFEYTDSISEDIIYYSTMNISGKYSNQELGSTILSENDSLLEILITDEVFINKFLTAEDSVLKSDEYLSQLIKGLYITCDDAISDGIMLTIDWSELSNTLSFQFSSDSMPNSKQIYYLDDQPTAINLFNHNYSDAYIEPFINNGSVDDSMIFLQSMAGVSPVIKIEGLTEWRDSVPVAILNARLFIPVVDSNITQQKSIYRPSKIDLYLKGESSYQQYYDDMLFKQGGGPDPGGTYDIETNSYIFNLKAHVQGIIEGDIENLEMIFKVNSGSENINRTVLQGWSQDPSKRMKLEITYIRL
jgi:hypothetical protein